MNIFVCEKDLPGHRDDGGNCVVYGRLLSSLLVEHSQNSIYGYSKSLLSNVYASPNWETYRAHRSIGARINFGSVTLREHRSVGRTSRHSRIHFDNIDSMCASVRREKFFRLHSRAVRLPRRRVFSTRCNLQQNANGNLSRARELSRSTRLTHQC